jgi:AraC-like DNA-binding protein
VILSSKLLTQADVRRLEKHSQVRFQSKGLLSADELDRLIKNALAGEDVLPPQTSALVKQALAYIHQNYARPLARWEVAQAAGASEDYLGRIFLRELGLSPWDYLTRCRVQQAKDLLQNTTLTIQVIARQVGFKDAAYFSRVFHKQCGVSPAQFRIQVLH